MIIKLLPNQIAEYWDSIKYALIQTNQLTPKDKLPEYCTNVLLNLYSGESQCWLILSDSREIKAVVITRIIKDIGNINYLMLDVVYGFQPTTIEEKIDSLDAIKDFQINTKCNNIFAYTANPMAINAMEKMGMKKAYQVYAIGVNYG